MELNLMFDTTLAALAGIGPRLAAVLQAPRPAGEDRSEAAGGL